MDINEIIKLTKSKYYIVKVLPYSRKNIDYLMEEGYFLSTVNYDTDNNWVEMIFMSLEGPVKYKAIVANLKEE